VTFIRVLCTLCTPDLTINNPTSHTHTQRGWDGEWTAELEDAVVNVTLAVEDHLAPLAATLGGAAALMGMGGEQVRGSIF
jgi:hypothetical protein